MIVSCHLSCHTSLIPSTNDVFRLSQCLGQDTLFNASSYEVLTRVRRRIGPSLTQMSLTACMEWNYSSTGLLIVYSKISHPRI